MTESEEIGFSYLDHLVKKHRDLDIFIEERRKAYAPNDEMARLKTEKLWIKDEIYRLQHEKNNEA